jgi:hypothetical protein
MLVTIARYLRYMPSIVKKLKICHRHSLLLDEATPDQLNMSLHAWSIFKRQQGYLRSLIENKCVDAHGNPIPWYNYPAIEQLSKWNFTDCDILEYGSGNSTLWWMKRAKSVTSIENSTEWYEYVSKQVTDNCKIVLSSVEMDREDEEQIKDYVECIDELGTFDVIIIDGVNKEGVRMQCARRALDHLKRGGILIIDNSDWLPDTCRMIRDRGFIEIDFSGLGPLLTHAETTSFFFGSEIRIKPKMETHPGFAIGGLKLYSDQRY